MLAEKLEQVTKELGWDFSYASSHWQNLRDLPDDSDKPFKDRKRYFMLIQYTQIKSFGDFYSVENSWRGEFLLLVRSLMTEKDYAYKYATHIKPLENELGQFERRFGAPCNRWTKRRMEITPFINLYDTNLDGLKVEFMMDYET